MKRILIESARARIMNESRTFACTTCWKYSEMKRIRDLDNTVTCPKCASKSVGVLSYGPEDVESVMQRNGKAVSKSDKRLADLLLQSAEIVRKYGKTAAVVQAGRRIQPSDAKKILRKEKRVSDRLIELIMQAERDALKRRFL